MENERFGKTDAHGAECTIHTTWWRSRKPKACPIKWNEPMSLMVYNVIRHITDEAIVEAPSLISNEGASTLKNDCYLFMCLFIHTEYTQSVR